MIRVGVSGAAGRMGSTVCDAVEQADGLELAGRADPALDTGLGDILGDCEVVVEFSTPDTSLDELDRLPRGRGPRRGRGNGFRPGRPEECGRRSR